MGNFISGASGRTQILSGALIVARDSLSPLDRQFLESLGFSRVIHYARTKEGIPHADLAEASVIWGSLYPSDIRSLAQAPRLRLIQLTNAGAERALQCPIWKEEASKDLWLANASGVHAVVIPQYFIATTLILFHKLQTQMLISQVEKRWTNGNEVAGGTLFIDELRGKTVGILGYGAIGRAAARLSAAFGANVIAANTSGRKKPYEGWTIPGTGDTFFSIPSAWYSTASPSSFAEFLHYTDVLLVALPSTPATRYILNEETLAHLQPTAIVVNIGRGDLVSTSALLAALDSGKLAGAALDVTDPEPLPTGHALFGRKNVIVTILHYIMSFSGRTNKYMQYARDILALNVERLRAGLKPVNSVDPQKGY
ncbi:hypothetical protein FISHEDRAFT_43344 [Fistulina hepatica ATCC 64428]|uniref:D-isomer specific 2-hydroxyacid dehydrogenase NAD-binding domain-containing protein n=1 Tax=Fistulina hepatica ATCC 64428 TaxID=1128425 RepID=A0A0D7ADD3_9AGAR|nr:hypothetical protein FISHEDRAFT_43344 [Fistulina hepatica ATCC 64428]